MERDVVWAATRWPGLDHLHLRVDADEVHADGVVIGVADNRAFRARYRVRCTPKWQVRDVHIMLLDSGEHVLHITSDGEGHWQADHGTPLPQLDGCLDVDISATPFTNTLPIRRLRLQIGESSELSVAYIELPSLELTADRQRYTALASDLYRYEGLTTDFTADLSNDKDGLVVEYPG